jgi:hypothetical protein
MKKKQTLIPLLITFIAVFTVLSFLPGPSRAAISGTGYDFKEVAVGVSQTKVVTITNLGTEPTEISGVVFDKTNCSDFYVFSVPLHIPIPPNGTQGVEIGYSPSSVGTCTDTLRVYNGNPFPTTMTVSGTGVMAAPKEPGPVDVTSQLAAQITEIKAFMAANLREGNLKAAGKGRESQRRLKAFKKMLIVTAHMIENGRLHAAQNKLRELHRKTDGKPRPQDFITGKAAKDLAARIEALIDRLNAV